MARPELSFDHMALRVRDPAATLSFYADTLGLKLAAVYSGEGWDGMDWLMMIFALDDGRQLALCALDGSEPLEAKGVSDLPHYAFSVKDAPALGQWRKRLEEANVPFKEEDHGGQQSIYFSDPNGLVLEITAPPSKTATARAVRKTAEAWIAAHS